MSMENHIERLINHVENNRNKRICFLSLENLIKAKVKLLKA